MSEDAVIKAHLEFFAKNRTGCAFAVIAAHENVKFEWACEVVPDQDPRSVADRIARAVETPDVSTLSLIFPDVLSASSLDKLIPQLRSDRLYLHSTLDTARNRCYRFRARIGPEDSYVSGFGPFCHFPTTRQAQHVALVLRVKPRPNYDWHLKKPEEGIIHVADMDMKGMSERALRRAWDNSFLATAGKLGHKPDQESAAKTTFVIPLERAAQIEL